MIAIVPNRSWAVAHARPLCSLPRPRQEHKDDNMQFMCRVFERSGIGANASYLPPWISPMHVRQSRNDMDSAMREAQMVMVGAVTDLLEKTGAWDTKG